jgi:quercetin dioxygenase-like cupin family protein
MNKKGPVNVKNVESINQMNGIFRKTLSYNNEVMLCYITLETDAELPLHDHEAHQIGYVIKGKIKFFTDTREFIVEKGDSYVFDSYEKHGAKIIDQAEVIEVFSPTRDEYK